jgi:hypothetical protein
MFSLFFGKKTVIILALIFSHLAANSACCSVQTGTVTTIGSLTNGIFFFTLNGPITNRGACNTSGRFALNTNNANHKTTMASILAAYIAEKQVQVIGLTTCTTWSDSDDVGSLSIQ